MPQQLISAHAEISADWLGDVLGRPLRLLDEPVGIGTGQMSESYRVRYAHDEDGEERTVIVKLPATDPTSRATGVGLGAYGREVSLYRNLAPRMGDGVPACHHAEIDPSTGEFVLVLGDAAPARVGDQIAGCSPEEARVALLQLARIQAPFVNDLILGSTDWLNLPNPLTQAVFGQLLPGCLERLGDRLDADQVGALQAFAERVDAWTADRRAPLGLVHGDFRLDNLLFDGDHCTVVDWQTVTWGSPLYDVAYFLGGSLRTDDRRAHEQELVRAYHEELVGLGVRDFAWEHCWEEYRRHAFGGVLLNVVASMVVEQTDRGDEMFRVLLDRHTRHILDMDAVALLPEAGAVPEALQPEPDDEALHEPGPEASWNESVYLDAVSDDGDLGVYARIGRLPNQDASVISVCLCGPGRPSVMLAVDPAPMPDVGGASQSLDDGGLRVAYDVEDPLRRARLRVAGTAAAHADASAPLRSEAGEPVEIAIDLVWETDAVPYAWRMATRYEIPCRVSGTVRVGDEELTLTGPGQRDHSWGTRDWWTLDWMWSGLHLQDGTRLHAVGVPGMPGGVGYVQRDGVVEELTVVETDAAPTSDGLTGPSQITLEPTGLVLDVEPVAFGALRFESPDGRVSHFPRAMCRIRTQDGRAGTGWVEWNRVQR